MSLTHYQRNKEWRKNNSSTWQKSKKRYYDKSRKIAYNSMQGWTLKDIDIIMSKNDTDNNIARKIGRSVKAIQTMRYRIKKFTTEELY